MNLDAWLKGEAFERFNNGTLRAVAPVEKRRDNGDSQVSASRGAGLAGRGR